jgi:hypothetical protein
MLVKFLRERNFKNHRTTEKDRKSIGCLCGVSAGLAQQEQHLDHLKLFCKTMQLSP